MIIGTTALAYHGIHLREPADVDVMYSINIDSNDDVIVMPQDIMNMIPHKNSHATVDAVYTIKMSHLGWDIKWRKHYNDVMKLQHLGAELIEPLYVALLAHWARVNGNNPNLCLYKKKGDFFNDAVPYVYDHDWLHKVVSSPHNPAYMTCLQAGQDVMIDKGRFDSMPLWKQLRMFKEEVTVIAAERWLLNPNCKGKYHWRQAYFLSLHKTITALTKGWATDFMLKHLDFFSKPDYTYFSNLYTRGIIMSKNLDRNSAATILNEIIEAYNTTDPKYSITGSATQSWEYLISEECFFPGFAHVETEGGEDEGSYAHTVFTWKDQLYKLVYSYSSYDGLDFDYAELYEVTQQQQTITVYK